MTIFVIFFLVWWVFELWITLRDSIYRNSSIVHILIFCRGVIYCNMGYYTWIQK